MIMGCQRIFLIDLRAVGRRSWSKPKRTRRTRLERDKARKSMTIISQWSKQKRWWDNRITTLIRCHKLQVQILTAICNRVTSRHTQWHQRLVRFNHIITMGVITWIPMVAIRVFKTRLIAGCHLLLSICHRYNSRHVICHTSPSVRETQLAQATSPHWWLSRVSHLKPQLEVECKIDRSILANQVAPFCRAHHRTMLFSHLVVWVLHWVEMLPMIRTQLEGTVGSSIRVQLLPRCHRRTGLCTISLNPVLEDKIALFRQATLHIISSLRC